MRPEDAERKLGMILEHAFRRHRGEVKVKCRLERVRGVPTTVCDVTVPAQYAAQGEIRMRILMRDGEHWIELAPRIEDTVSGLEMELENLLSTLEWIKRELRL